MDDPKLGTDAGRLANRADMIKLIEDWLATFPDRDSAVAHMQQNAVPAAPVLSIEETVSHPHLRPASCPSSKLSPHGFIGGFAWAIACLHDHADTNGVPDQGFEEPRPV